MKIQDTESYINYLRCPVYVGLFGQLAIDKMFDYSLSLCMTRW